MNNWEIIKLSCVDSTNDEAKKCCYRIQEDKFAIIADKQNNGRGRRGRSWVGLEGNLFCSLGIKCPLEKSGELVFVTSLALVNTILKIKWPNDVLLNGAKISGILLEAGSNEVMIVGIGVNIVAKPETNIANYPIGCLADMGIKTDKVSFLNRLLENFDTKENLWKSNGFAAIKQQWLKFVKGLGEKIVIQQEKNNKEGIFVGIDDCGALLLKANDKIEKIYAGDIFFENKENIKE